MRCVSLIQSAYITAKRFLIPSSFLRSFTFLTRFAMIKEKPPNVGNVRLKKGIAVAPHERLFERDCKRKKKERQKKKERRRRKADGVCFVLIFSASRNG